MLRTTQIQGHLVSIVGTNSGGIYVSPENQKKYGFGPFGKSGKSCPRSSVLIGLISCQKLVETFHHFFAEYHSLNK